MSDVKDDAQFESVIRILKGLPKIDATPTFEMDLRRRLNTESNTAVNSRIKFLSPSRLIPSAALAAAAIILLFFMNIEAPLIDDPLSMEPLAREDVLTGSSAEQYLNDISIRRDNNSPGTASNVNYIVKSGLNFRQINLTDDEKVKLQHLKEKFKKLLGEQKKQ